LSLKGVLGVYLRFCLRSMAANGDCSLCDSVLGAAATRRGDRQVSAACAGGLRQITCAPPAAPRLPHRACERRTEAGGESPRQERWREEEAAALRPCRASRAR